MRVLLDAYFDNNFGDDLFIDTLLTRYPDDLFYVFWKETPAHVRVNAEHFRNLVILPANCELQQTPMFDTYVMIGGDVLPDGMDHSGRIGMMEAVKEGGGFVAMLGFNLFDSYGSEVREQLVRMSELADVIVTRDLSSAERYRKYAPDARIIAGADMAFVRENVRLTEDEREKTCQILGMAARRKLYSSEDEYGIYCKSMAKLADAYLAQKGDRCVRFLAFSSGLYDDARTAQDIIDCMRNATHTEICVYRGGLEPFEKSIEECTCMVPTRFHGLIFALKGRIPFLPVPYEVKVSQLLDELGYQGEAVAYGEEVSDDRAGKLMQGLESFPVAEERLAAYEGRADLFFAALDQWMNSGNRERDEAYGSFVCQSVRQLEECSAERDLLKRQVEELNKWIHALQAERARFEQQNMELEQMRVAVEQKYSAAEQKLQELELHDQELMRWIESLQGERKLFERQNREIEAHRKWLWDKLQSKTYNKPKLQRQYDEFMANLPKMLDEATADVE